MTVSREVNGFTLSELRFPPSYVQVAFDPELPYLALVLDGSLEKSFRRRTMRLDRASGVTMPAGAWHGARSGLRALGSRSFSPGMHRDLPPIVSTGSSSFAGTASVGSLASCR